MKICSLVPGATEVVAALGLADQLVGISHGGTNCRLSDADRSIWSMRSHTSAARAHGSSMEWNSWRRSFIRPVSTIGSMQPSSDSQHRPFRHR